MHMREGPPKYYPPDLLPGENPKLILDPLGHILCPVHGEPFRAKWPVGIAQIIILGTEYIQEYHEGFTNHIKTPDDITRLLAERQVCCRVGPERCMAMYTAANIASLDLCDACGKYGPGTPFSFRNFWGRAIKKRHVCFTCILATAEKAG